MSYKLLPESQALPMLAAEAQQLAEFEHYEQTVQDIADLKEAVNDLTGDDEFGSALVDHFPVEDKMPTFSQVQEFLNNRFDRDYDPDTVDLICMIMELHYDVDYCVRCHDDDDALVETDVGYLCSSCEPSAIQSCPPDTEIAEPPVIESTPPPTEIA